MRPGETIAQWYERMEATFFGPLRAIRDGIADSLACYCDECGAGEPDDASDMIGTWHEDHCSLHTDNVVL